MAIKYEEAAAMFAQAGGCPRLTLEPRIDLEQGLLERIYVLHNDQPIIELASGKWMLAAHGNLSEDRRQVFNRFIPAEILVQDGLWVVKSGEGKDAYFRDGIMLRETPDEAKSLFITGEVSGGALKELATEVKELGKFSRDMILALRAGRVSKPGTGTCAHCAIVYNGEPRQTLGELTNNNHIQHHIRYGHLHIPELLLRSVEVASQEFKDAVTPTLRSIWTEEKFPPEGDPVWGILHKILRSYLCSSLGFAY